MDYKPPIELLKKVGFLWDSAEASKKDLESLRLELLTKRVELSRLLDETKLRVLIPKSSQSLSETKMTELDRTIHLNATVAPITHDAELLKGIEELIKDRLYFYSRNAL